MTQEELEQFIDTFVSEHEDLIEALGNEDKSDLYQQ